MFASMFTSIWEGVQKAIRWLLSLNTKTVLIAILLVSDAAHSGALFASMEASDRSMIGYIMAFCLDAVGAIALVEFTSASKRLHRGFASLVFLLACGVAGAFNSLYYMQYNPNVQWSICVLLGSAGPILAAMLSIMRGFEAVTHVEARQSAQEAQMALELQKYEVEQAEVTKRQGIAEVEATKRERAKARAIKAQAEAQVRVQVQASVAQAQASEAQAIDKLIASLGKAGAILKLYIDNPAQSQSSVAQALGISRQAVGQHLRKLEQEGLVRRNGQGVEVLI